MRKSTTVQIRIEEEEKQGWAVLAAAMGVSLSDWIRGRCNGAGERADAALVKVGAKMQEVPDVGKGELGVQPWKEVGVEELRKTYPAPRVCTKHKLVEPCRRCG